MKLIIKLLLLSICLNFLSVNLHAQYRDKFQINPVQSLQAKLCTYVDLSYFPGDWWPVCKSFIVNDNVDSILIDNKDVVTIMNSLNPYVTFCDNAISLCWDYNQYLFMVDEFDESWIFDVQEYNNDCYDKIDAESEEYKIKLENGKYVELKVSQILAWFKVTKLEGSDRADSIKNELLGKESTERIDSLVAPVAIIATQKPKQNIFKQKYKY